ncbi:MAG: glycosyltransferase [Acidobacteria bacterium]|nr:glycosyltransferase [Acidobacteriota bacterium]
MSLSVIVTSYNSTELLERCLQSLALQPEAAEIVVVDCSPVNPAATLATLFPSVRFIHLSDKATVPEMRWRAFRETSGSLVAAVEARSVPAANWCGALVQAHLQNPGVPAAGGPVCLAPVATLLDTALFLCEYGAFAPPLSEGPASELNSANVCYKRADLLACDDLMEQGRWDAILHARWLAQGRRFQLCGAAIVFFNTMPLGDILRQRFHYGWSYAADRVAAAPRPAALSGAATTPLLPLLLLVRMWSWAGPKGLRGQLIRALGWVLLFQSAWSAGECAGYLLGSPSERHVY